MKLVVRRFSCAFLWFLFLCTFPVVAETGTPTSPTKKPSTGTPRDLGIIFNVAGLPLDLEAYQAGLGMKVGWEDLYLRGLLDLVASRAPDAFAANVGATVEYHLTPEPLSFYVGGAGGAGYMRQAGSYSSFVLSLGAIAGVEYFPLKFLSVFVEYALSADLTWTTNLSTSETTFDYLIDTRLGNDSKIGIVIHLLRLRGK